MKKKSKHPPHSLQRAIEAAERSRYEPEPPTEHERQIDLLMLASQIERHGFAKYASDIANVDIETMTQLLELVADLAHEGYRLRNAALFD